jgi:ABC-type hemin transport system ATPase subunit
MLAGWHAAEASSIAHLEARHQHQLAQYARQLAGQAMTIARLHQDLDAARSEIDRLTVRLRAAGAQLYDGPEHETL